MKAKVLNLFGLMVILSLVFMNTASAQPTTQLPVSQRLQIAQVTRGDSMKNAMRLPDGRVRVLVQLSQAPVALYQGGVSGLKATNPATLGVKKLDASSPASQAYATYLKTAQ